MGHYKGYGLGFLIPSVLNPIPFQKVKKQPRPGLLGWRHRVSGDGRNVYAGASFPRLEYRAPTEKP